MLEAEQLKIQGSKQKIGKTHVYKLIVDAIPYKFPWFILVIKAIFWASNVRPFILKRLIFRALTVWAEGVNLSVVDHVKRPS